MSRVVHLIVPDYFPLTDPVYLVEVGAVSPHCAVCPEPRETCRQCREDPATRRLARVPGVKAVLTSDEDTARELRRDP